MLALLRYLVGLIIIALLASCGSGRSATPTPATAELFRVAVLLPGPIDDQSWSQAGYEGLQLIGRELGAETAYSATVSEAGAASEFRRYAVAGFNMIVGHGEQFYAAAEQVASEFPRIGFVVLGSQAGNNVNLGSISFRNGELGYLTGVVAALKTKSNRIVYLGGMPNQAQQECAAEVVRGAQATKPDVEVEVQWLNSWTDQRKAQALTQAALAAGSDVLIQNADSAGMAVFREAERAGAYAIGWTQDQYALAPGTIITSGVQRLPVLYLRAAVLIGRGRWEGKKYRFGLREQAHQLAPFRGALSAEQATYVENVREQIMTGKLEIMP